MQKERITERIEEIAGQIDGMCGVSAIVADETDELRSKLASTSEELEKYRKFWKLEYDDNQNLKKEVVTLKASIETYKQALKSLCATVQSEL